MRFDLAFFPARFATLDADAWDADFYAVFTEGVGMPDYLYPPDEMPKFLDMLCCNRPQEQCYCDETLTFSEAFSIGQEAYVSRGYDLQDYAYELNDRGISLCEGCTHFATFRCKPFREWLRIITTSEQMLADKGLDTRMRYIEPCREYIPNARVPQAELDEVVAHLAHNDELLGNSDLNFIEELPEEIIDSTSTFWID